MADPASAVVSIVVSQRGIVADTARIFELKTETGRIKVAHLLNAIFTSKYYHNWEVPSQSVEIFKDNIKLRGTDVLRDQDEVEILIHRTPPCISSFSLMIIKNTIIFIF